MPRVIRRQSVYQRISSSLNPLDHLLRLATDFEAFDWDNWQNTWGTPLGLLLNVFCMIARGQADKFRRVGADDVFRRSSTSSPVAAGLSYFLWLSSWVLAALSFGNAVYCFTRKRRYRMFEQSIEVEPATPSARRVPVNSSPVANSPLRLFNSIIEPFRSDADSRAHPDETRDVWEIGVWDPTPLSLHLLALFSPVHVAIYFLSLPLDNKMAGYPMVGYESSPASVYFTVIMSQILLSLQIIFIKSSFIQQRQDHKVIGSQVMHEYDQKYVHPRLNVIKRDVAIQCDSPGYSDDVEVYTPQFNRTGFKTYANPNYSSFTTQRQPSSLGNTSRPVTRESSFSSTPAGTPLQVQRIRQPVFDRASGGGGGGGGGSVLDSARRAATAASSSSSSTPLDARGRERYFGGSSGSEHAGYDQPTRRMGMSMGTDGLVDWSRQNSRGLSPSKMSSPLKKGSTIRGSTYAESLGTPLGTPRRRQF